MHFLTRHHKALVYIGLYCFTAGLIASLFLLVPNEHNDFPLLRTMIVGFATILLTKYAIYMALSPWYDVRERYRSRRSGTAAYRPLVSVIIPAWNEEVGLVTTVKSILKSRYRNVEIIVINDGSTDDSDRLFREFLASYEAIPDNPNKMRIVYRYKENGGKGLALNKGIELSSGEIIVSIDADCALLPSTIGSFVEHFRDPSVMAAVGNVRIGNTDHFLGALQNLEFLFSFYFKKADSLCNTIYIIGGAAGAFRREVFDKVGYYSNTNITEDIDLSVRIQEAGMRIVYAADAVVYTEGASELSSLMKQRLRWKRGRFQTFWEHRRLFFSNRARHNKFLTWGVLPLALFGDLELFFEVLFLAFLYIYSTVTHDFSSFISGIIVVSLIFAIQIFDDPRSTRPSLYLLAPIGWLLFYVTTIVEYRALITSLRGMLSGQQIRWQRWERAGLSVSGTRKGAPSSVVQS
ncbi:MAG TPA: glycosyltransferase family 2 protein [Candidatus Paceibacterota bacterium]|nr:glycosyltransferase family 2 protein [Candidatus Paceibacterota bacterium]